MTKFTKIMICSITKSNTALIWFVRFGLKAYCPCARFVNTYKLGAKTTKISIYNFNIEIVNKSMINSKKKQIVPNIGCPSGRHKSVSRGRFTKSDIHLTQTQVWNLIGHLRHFLKQCLRNWSRSSSTTHAWVLILKDWKCKHFEWKDLITVVSHNSMFIIFWW